MRIKLRTLRKIICEAISESHKNKLEVLFGSFEDQASYRQAWELWETMDPGTCPYPPPDEFYRPDGQPRVLDLFGKTVMAANDPAYFDKYCSVFWIDPKESLSFEFDFPFECGDEQGNLDYVPDEPLYVVAGTNQSEIIQQVIQALGSEMKRIGAGALWSYPEEIKVTYISGQDYIRSMDRGSVTVLVRYR